MALQVLWDKKVTQAEMDTQVCLENQVKKESLVFLAKMEHQVLMDPEDYQE